GLSGRRHRAGVPRPGAAPRGRLQSALARAAGGPARQGRARPARRPGDRLGRGAVAGRRLAGARSVRHVRRHVPRPPGPAADPDVGDVRRGLPAAEGLPAARPLQPGGAGAPGAQRQPRGALLDGGAVDRRGVRRPPARHAGAPASRRARQDPQLRMSKRTIAVELATPGLDPQGRPARIPLEAGVGARERYGEGERIYNLQEMWTGARLTTSVTRVGGMMADVTEDFIAGLRQFVDTYPKTLHEIDRVLTRNAVWVGRTQGVGVMTAPEAINYSLS